MPAALNAEILQRAPFDSLEEEVFLALQLTARTVMDPWARYLKSEAGLTPVQYNLLRILRGAHPQGRTCGEISARLVTRDPDVTRIVDRLEKRGQVRRERSREDRRVVHVFISGKGLAVLKALDRAVRPMPRKILGPLGERRLLLLRDLLSATRAEMGELSLRRLRRSTRADHDGGT